MIRLTRKQAEYVRNASHRWNIKVGAVRSGKTYLDTEYTILKRIRASSGKEGLIVLLGNTRGTLQRNILEPMQARFGSELVSNIRCLGRTATAWARTRSVRSANYRAQL